MVPSFLTDTTLQESIRMGFSKFSSAFCASETWNHNIHLNIWLFFCNKPKTTQIRSLSTETFVAWEDMDPWITKKRCELNGVRWVCVTMEAPTFWHYTACLLLQGSHMSKGLRFGLYLLCNWRLCATVTSESVMSFWVLVSSPGQAPKSQGEGKGETLGRSQAVEKKRKAEAESEKLNKT